MAKIRPFKAVRPTRDKVHLVASRPYYTYKPNILAAKLESNPYTFIHIINPEFNLSDEDKTEPNSPQRFMKVRDKFNDFVKDGVLMQEEVPSYYIYQQTKNGHPFLGVIAGASISEYYENKIKKHEATLTSREEMFTNYLDIVGFNAEPVLLAHEKNIALDDLLVKICSDRPEFEFTTVDEVKHELWVVPENQNSLLEDRFDEISVTYIADGHHRSASSARLSDLIKHRYPNQEGSINSDFFLAYFIDESRLKILEFNRLAKTLNGHTNESFLEILNNDFVITKLDGACSPTQPHVFHICLSNGWYRAECKPGLTNSSDPVATIDAEILTQHVLSPILNIQDLKTDSNIDFSNGEEGHLGLEHAVQKGDYKVGFALFPVTMSQLKAVADKDAIMPPKSTWIEPKLRSGLTIYKIQE